MKQRIEYFDLLKGIAIFLVVMGHALTMCIRGIDAAFLFKLIGQVHMPIFFFISGFLTYKDTFAPPALMKRFLQLIIPFFVVKVFNFIQLKLPFSGNNWSHVHKCWVHSLCCYLAG